MDSKYYGKEDEKSKHGKLLINRIEEEQSSKALDVTSPLQDDLRKGLNIQELLGKVNKVRHIALKKSFAALIFS